MEKINFKYKDGSNVYLTSDTHFNHGNIIKFCKRPFKDAEEMNQMLIENWNKKVPKDGIVFHLGDFAWGGYEAWKNIREQLNGEIILIKGNHEMKNLTPKAEKELFKYSTWQMMVEIEGRKVLLNHFPYLCYSGVYRDANAQVYQCFGHVHLSNVAERNGGKDCPRCFDMLYPLQYDVGVDFNNFTPLSWYEVNEKIQTQIKENANQKIWINN